MISMKKVCAVLAATAALSAGSLTAASAGPVADLGSGAATPNIIGGSQATSPWAVQLRFNVTGSNGTSGCTGEQLNSRWILTAKHCIDGAYNMKVYHSNDQLNPGASVSATRLLSAPSGDIALVQLDRPVHLTSYPRLNFNYTPTIGDTGVIAGYGLGAWDQPTTTLRSATVRVTGTSRDAYGGSAVQLNGVTGAANRGDSGGPLLVNGRIVAVCSTGDRFPGGNINARSNYALLSQSANWIQRTAGLTTLRGTTADDESAPLAEAAQ
ncbi:S1 family peptidase [Rothia nasimurium]|uniref:S1 family peptidase n=1 Tax=Rothia nasimurium TaxID=85336 RepID=UPI001F17D1E7|nr:S1 family peptidase [Rothia nasimurium]